ncbi:gas vesicle protein [Halorarum halophilum]|uniref:Gas vesicle protein n=1 Tax=Halorarum halophilum TaxID=2743090 RepID=A0A7D5GCY6_9EURY|nr:gas vesicle protein [Halobaculum halophilum]
MPETRPTRDQSDLADVLELVLDKGVVINADVVVSVGDTRLLSVEIRAAIASFDTAAEYGLQFPSGTDTDRVAAAAGVPPIRDRPEDQATLDELGIEAATSGGGSGNDGDAVEIEADEESEADDEADDEAEPEEVPEADDQD